MGKNISIQRAKSLLDQIIDDRSMVHLSRAQLLDSMKNKKCELDVKQESIYKHLCCGGKVQSNWKIISTY